MKQNTKKLAAMGMLCALAYAAAAGGRVPLVLFLKYDPKDALLALGGFLWGPAAAVCTAAAVSLLEMVTVSENGVLGFVMNVISSSCFAGTAALVYRRRRSFSGAVTGLLCGWGCMVAAMMFWNYLVAPIYMGCSRQEVAQLLLPVFLPFNLIKGGLNAAITAMLYKTIWYIERRR